MFREARGEVHACGKPDVVVLRKKADSRMRRRDDCKLPGVARVVDDKHLVIVREKCFKRTQAALQIFVDLVVDDESRNRHLNES